MATGKKYTIYMTADLANWLDSKEWLNATNDSKSALVQNALKAYREKMENAQQGEE